MMAVYQGARVTLAAMRGFTLLEMLMMVIIVGVLASVAVPPMGRALDRAAVFEATQRYTAMHETARALAIARGRPARIELDTARREVVLSLRRTGMAWDTLDTRPLGRAAISATQTTIAFSPLGIGFGVSNSRIVVRRGAAADTLTISRTGRLRHS